MSYIPSVSGIRLDANSALTVTVSESPESPMFILPSGPAFKVAIPSTLKLPDMVVLPPTCKLVSTCNPPLTMLVAELSLNVALGDNNLVDWIESSLSFNSLIAPPSVLASVPILESTVPRLLSTAFNAETKPPDPAVNVLMSPTESNN